MKDVQISEFAAIVNPQLSSGGARPWGSDALSSELTKGSGWIGSGKPKETSRPPDPFITPSGTASPHHRVR